MELVKITIEKLLKAAILKIKPDFNDWERLFLQPASDKKFGDYQTNFAMSASKIFGQPPKIIAESIVSALPENEIVKRAEIAGAGFINIFLKEAFISKTIKECFKNSWDFDHIDKRGKVVIDYSSQIGRAHV